MISSIASAALERACETVLAVTSTPRSSCATSGVTVTVPVPLTLSPPLVDAAECDLRGAVVGHDDQYPNENGDDSDGTAGEDSDGL